MRIVLVDDSIPFDGYSPTSEPLGGAEKAFAYLAAALAKRGHEVAVFNRSPARRTMAGAAWEGWQTPPDETDVLIAFRRPSLLGFVPNATRRMLWLAAPAALLERPRSQALLEQYKPVVVFLSVHQFGERAPLDGLQTAIIQPGLAADYVESPDGAGDLNTPAIVPADPPRAVATTHPLAGLDWLVRLWTGKVHPIAPTAELHIYSAVLDRGVLGGDVPEAYADILRQVRNAAGDGVVVHRPLPDPGMAEAYRSARVHLYPGAKDDIFGWTLAETQAVGLPAVARPLGAVYEQVSDNSTGIVADDGDAFANAALRILNDESTFQRISRMARVTKAGRTWDVVAAEFEDRFQ